MTVIAFDGRSMASDRQSTFGGTPVRTTKVFKVRRDGRRFLFGSAGSTAECYAYQQWAMGRRDKPTFAELSVLCVDEQMRLWRADENMLWYPVRARFWAIGSGADYALGAMAAGKCARAAVLIAIQLCNTCGMGVDVVRF